MRYAYLIVHRLLVLTLLYYACRYFASHVGPWGAVPIMALIVLTACLAIAFAMKSQTPGKITVINSLAMMILPWGYQIGRGKLISIIVASWLRWVAICVFIIVLLPHGLNATNILLLLSWIIDLAVILRLTTLISIRSNSNPLPAGRLMPIFGLAALFTASIWLTIFRNSPETIKLALLLTGGPIAFVGGGYLLFLLVMLTLGRNARWN